MSFAVAAPAFPFALIAMGLGRMNISLRNFLRRDTRMFIDTSP
jgi:hypothetical protein